MVQEAPGGWHEPSEQVRLAPGAPGGSGQTVLREVTLNSIKLVGDGRGGHDRLDRDDRSGGARGTASDESRPR